MLEHNNVTNTGIYKFAAPNIPKHVTLTNVSTESLTVSWEAPEEQFTGYAIWLRAVADARRSFNAGTRTASFRDLVAGQEYTVVVVAESGDQESAELTGSFYTSKFSVLSSQVINSKQPNLGLTQESLRMVTARVLVVLSGSFTSQIETGPTLT